jgi:hypothetical protein
LKFHSLLRWSRSIINSLWCIDIYSSLLFVRFQSLVLTCTCVHTRIYIFHNGLLYSYASTSYSEHEEKFTHPFPIIIFCLHARLLASAHTHTFIYIYIYIHSFTFYFIVIVIVFLIQCLSRALPSVLFPK